MLLVILQHIELYAPWSEIIFLLHHTKTTDDVSFFDQTPIMRSISTKYFCLDVQESLPYEIYQAALDDVREKLAATIIKLAEYTKMIPCAWHTARRHLRSQLSVYESMSYSQFEILCKNNGVAREDKNTPGVTKALLDWFGKSKLCFPYSQIKRTIEFSEDAILYSPIRMMIGIYRTLEFAREKNGRVKERGLLERLWEVETPSASPFTQRDIDVILAYLREYRLCFHYTEAGKDVYLFPIYLKLPEKDGKRKRDGMYDEYLREEKRKRDGTHNEDFRKWLTEKTLRADGTYALHYVGTFEFISNAIVSAIILQTRELFEDWKKNGLPLEPLTELNDEPFRSWYPMDADGAFFALKHKNGTVRMYIGRTLDLNGELHIFIYDQSGQVPQDDLKSAAAVVIQAAKKVYEGKPGYLMRVSHQFGVDVQSKGENILMPLNEIRQYWDVGYDGNIFVARLKRNEDIAQMMEDFYVDQTNPLPDGWRGWSRKNF